MGGTVYGPSPSTYSVPRRIASDVAPLWAQSGRQRGVAECAVRGCGPKQIVAHGWCWVHYQRWRATGDPGPAELLHQGSPPPENLDDIVKAGPACNPDTATLFDAEHEGETKQERAARHWGAALICRECPALALCKQALPEVVDTAPTTTGGAGVWAGYLVLANGPVRITDPSKIHCYRCGQYLDPEEFTPAWRHQRSASCRSCTAAYKRSRRAEARAA